MAAEIKFRAMGTDIHVTINGDDSLLGLARAEVFRLEKLWSRFDEDSEISRINSSNGQSVKISTDTQQLIELGIQGWQETNGLFDPTVFGDIIRAGYIESFESFSQKIANVKSRYRLGIEGISIEDGFVSMPRNVGFDPGGIGKGLAADLIAAELMQEGAHGVCVNIGGDIKVLGKNVISDSWNIDIESNSQTLDSISITQGAVATSTTLLRRWKDENGEFVHHIIDPRTGKSTTSPIVQVSVIASHGWQAEVLAKAALIDGSMNLFEHVESHDAAAMAIDMDGKQIASSKWNHFTQAEYTC